MWIGVPVRANCEPACAPNARGIRSRDGGVLERIATSTTIGISAATAPFTPIKAVRSATMIIIATVSRRGLSPAIDTIR